MNADQPTNESCKRPFGKARSAILWMVVVVSFAAALFKPGGNMDWNVMEDAAMTLMAHGNPYVAEQGRVPSYPYSPIWLPVTTAMVTLGQPQFVLLACYLAGLLLLPNAYKDKPLTALVGLGLFVTLWGGNVAALEFTLVCAVFRLVHCGAAGKAAALLGLAASMKVLPLAFLAGFRRKTWLGAVSFLAALGCGFAVYASVFSDWMKGIIGIKDRSAAASEAWNVVGFDNQAVYQHGWIVSALVAVVVCWAAWRLLQGETKPDHRLAIVMLGTLLLFPRIPPYAWLPYAGVPLLVLYQNFSERTRWIAVALLCAAGGLLACRSLGAPVPATLPYWSVLAVLVFSRP